MAEEKDDARALRAAQVPDVAAPNLPYRPQVPKSYQPRIGLVGCGGIAGTHLEAYRKMGYSVVVCCDVERESAEKQRLQFYPEADVCSDYRDVLDRGDIDVVDITTHPQERVQIIRDSLEAGKHVLSQKPFVTDLEVGRSLVKLADDKGLKLAVNQNGRWAPYFSYLRQLVAAGHLGDISSVDVHIAWDHTWIKGTPFETIRHVILYDFAIHWFDIVACVFRDRTPKQVSARTVRVANQEVSPALTAQAVVEYEGGLATLVFHANTKFAPLESTVVIGSKATFRSSGPVCSNDCISLTTRAGRAQVELEGEWFPDGFAGTMGELLCSIEEGREPENAARHNLSSLELCFAAVASADSGGPVRPGDSLTVPD